MSTLILVALICLIVGAVVGSLLTKTLHPQEKLRRELQDELTRAREEHKNYQQEVSEHFAQTADLVRNLSHNFQTVHEQLTQSAVRLATPEISHKLMRATSGTTLGAGKGSVSDTTLSALVPEPPRDYAPKVPGGILSEHYGLEHDLASRTATPSEATKKGGIKSEGRLDEDEDPTLKVG